VTVRTTITLLGVVLMLLATPVQAGPTPAGDYHWARKQSQFTLQVGDNVNGVWSGMLRKAVSDWNTSGTVMFRLVSGGTNPQDCRPTTGRVEVCAWPYGTQEGWLGLTRLYFDDRGEHIESASERRPVQQRHGAATHHVSRTGSYARPRARQHQLLHER
jgi:hypothetical protein